MFTADWAGRQRIGEAWVSFVALRGSVLESRRELPHLADVMLQARRACPRGAVPHDCRDIQCPALLTV